MQDNVNTFLKNNDLASLINLLESGALSPTWEDTYGWTLMHHAAAKGSSDLADSLITAGGTAHRITHNLHLPSDIATFFGHDMLALFLREQERLEKSSLTPPDIGYKSLDEIRKASDTTGVSQFARIAAIDAFDQVLNLAKSEGFQPQDLLQPGFDGTSALDILLRRGDGASLMQRAYFEKTPETLDALHQILPQEVRKTLKTTELRAALSGDTSHKKFKMKPR